MSAIDSILGRVEEGYAAFLLTGRSLHDLVVDPADGKLRPLREALRRACADRFGMAFVQYSMAGGLEWGHGRLDDERDRRTIEQALRTHHLLEIAQDQNEAVRVVRGIHALSRTPAAGLAWADGRPMRFAFLLEFAEHLAPGQLPAGSQTETQLVTIELAHLLGQSLALRSSGNVVFFQGRDGLVDELVSRVLDPVRLPQPGYDEKLAFLDAAQQLYAGSSFADDLPREAVANLTRHTPNRGVEALLRASHRMKRPVTTRELAAQKSLDVQEMSEQTLRVLNTARVDGLALRGLNVTKPLEILQKVAGRLATGDPNMPLSILLAGGPGFGKTDLAILTARDGKAAAYQLLSPKGGIVGETERKVRLQWTALNELGGIAFADEITEALPLERGGFDGDSGASRAVTATLLTELSNEAARGRRLLIATTNCPWRMGAAMRSRFTVIPVLRPLERDFPAVVVSTARRVDPEAHLDENDPLVREAGSVFYAKGANPRQIRGQLGNVQLLHGSLTPERVLLAANDMCPSQDLASAIYADLWAVKACTSASFLPWGDDPAAYPFPPYLAGLVAPKTGTLDVVELDKRIREYEGAANV